MDKDENVETGRLNHKRKKKRKRRWGRGREKKFLISWEKLNFRSLISFLYLGGGSKVFFSQPFFISETIFNSFFLPLLTQQQLSDVQERKLQLQQSYKDISGTCSKCNKAFTGLYLRVCNYRAIFYVICSHKYCLIPHVIMLVLTFKYCQA